MSPSVPNIALLGSGTFAKASYLPAILNLQGKVLNLHTIWSRSEATAGSLLSTAQELQSTSHSDSSTFSPTLKHGPEGLEAVLSDKDVEGVMIVLPITAQPEIVRKALKAGKHVISEKPLAKDVKDALALVEEYEREYKPKGLIWRVAENYSHEPVLREAGKVLSSTPGLGPILFWQLKFEAYVEDGSKYHKTGWRTIPDYQGGFLLDGGVHWTALLRVVLPASARPSSLIGFSALHRTHLLPHDTLQAISLPPSSSTTDSHGPKTKLTTAETTESQIPTSIGQSSPRGQIHFSFAASDIPVEKKQPNGISITCLNGVVNLISNNKTRNWELEVVPAKLQGEISHVEPIRKEGPMEGVEVEIDHFAQAISSLKQGKDLKDLEESDYGKPRDALWDLAVLEAMLNSNGKEISVDKLIGN
ncbi:NAD-binding Rossmann fold oxidoreductase [Kwoniella heveanensis BCC8398]|uniref:NAD-binding Rossmann fold oxidoreductase n=1 Tax=Kwoniella heveanensis BCC8398 TaxID=1296120 RepID=A0A1B9H3M1_9TREE|nr:NAD-binding Rossmann fold oxidoreductase [Kwoniella heveanensis BCC8398]